VSNDGSGVEFLAHRIDGIAVFFLVFRVQSKQWLAGRGINYGKARGLPAGKSRQRVPLGDDRAELCLMTSRLVSGVFFFIFLLMTLSCLALQLFCSSSSSGLLRRPRQRVHYTRTPLPSQSAFRT
jgi:hypothetical protein